jgi:hypothetical protein
VFLLRYSLPAVAALTLTSAICAAQVPAGPGDHDATIHFTTSCRAAVGAQFNHAIARLHSFAFAQVNAAMTEVLRSDPGCAMASWALALSAWGNPFAPGIRSAGQLERGSNLVRSARGTGQPTPRERSYIEAVARLYDNATTRSQRERLLDYRDAMAALALSQPADTEARIFYALALASSADPTDKSYQSQRAAAGILEPLFTALPDHPGLAHYLIHAYDVPGLAPKGIPAARQYSLIAPQVSHALHMPSHTFTRVGMWRESIVANAAAAARAHMEGSIAEELHAMDYAAYAWLQVGNDTAAASLVAALPSLARSLDPNLQTTGAPPAAGYYALAAIPARYALERGRWADAARLDQTHSPVPYADALTAFARALGGARSGDTVTAIRALTDLDSLRAVLVSRQEGYWTEQLQIERLGAAAWLSLASGRSREALAQMQTAAEREEATERSVLSPGPLAPARELLGEMQLATGDPAGALQSFERSLSHDPARLRSLLGAAAAAASAGENAKAQAYRHQLEPICSSAPQSAREPACREDR